MGRICYSPLFHLNNAYAYGDASFSALTALPLIGAAHMYSDACCGTGNLARQIGSRVIERHAAMTPAQVSSEGGRLIRIASRHNELGISAAI
jgi:hypothetical protein